MQGSTRALKCSEQGKPSQLTVVRRIWPGHNPIPRKPTLTMTRLGCHGVNGTFKAVKRHHLAPLRDTKRHTYLLPKTSQIASVELLSN